MTQERNHGIKTDLIALSRYEMAVSKVCDDIIGAYEKGAIGLEDAVRAARQHCGREWRKYLATYGGGHHVGA